MTTNHTKSERRKHTAYWVATGLLVFGMVLGGIGQLSYAKFNADGMIRLGYPLYTMRIIGAWKLLGVVAILVPGYGLLKEWAYAGFFFILSGAVLSHLSADEPIQAWIASFTFTILTVLSWYLRPANCRIVVPDGTNPVPPAVKTLR
jgi:hypothetical protein